MGAKFMVTLDSVSYASKPTAKDAIAITRRMQGAGATECDAATFCQHVKQGRTWVGGCYEPKRGAWGEFIGQQIFGIDIDNSAELIVNGQIVKDADGHKVKRALRPGEAGYLDPVDALDRCERLQLAPMCLYFTMGAKCPEWPKYRIVFDMGEQLDQDTAQAVIQSLLAAFPEADPQCKNCNRLYYGGSGEVWECWRVWDDAI